jgi:hypothetical protein
VLDRPPAGIFREEEPTTNIMAIESSSPRRPATTTAKTSIMSPLVLLILSALFGSSSGWSSSSSSISPIVRVRVGVATRHPRAFSSPTTSKATTTSSTKSSTSYYPPRSIGWSSSYPTRLPSTTAAASSSSADVEKDPPLLEPFLTGILRDYRMRLPYYKSDVTDGLNVQCLAAILFLFFACLAPAVGFGALFGSVTNGAIGTMEMVRATHHARRVYIM